MVDAAALVAGVRGVDGRHVDPRSKGLPHAQQKGVLQARKLIRGEARDGFASRQHLASIVADKRACGKIARGAEAPALGAQQDHAWRRRGSLHRETVGAPRQ